jgi:hypothetical protein
MSKSNYDRIKINDDGTVTVDVPIPTAVRSAEYIVLSMKLQKPKRGMLDVEMWPSETPPVVRVTPMWPYVMYKYSDGREDSDRSVSTTGDLRCPDTSASTKDW